MISWVSDFLASMNWNEVLLGVGLFCISLIVSFAAIGIVMVRIPENYFSSHYQRDFMPNSPWLVRWGAVIAKNILGVFLIAVGIILSIPGVPGQGILTILLGLIMIDIPGKRPLETRIIRRPAVLNAVNRLRSRYHRPPLLMD